MISYNSIKVAGINIFYREVKNLDKPTIILFHGFPSASHMFRDLIPLLADSFHIIAPDYPGFGQSDCPNRNEFSYTFENLSNIMSQFLQQLKIEKYYMYVFDYGAPIGFRIALNSPESILGIISQNGNIYEDGLGEKWQFRKDFWENPTAEKRDSYKTAFSPETIISQYTYGTEKNSVSPDGYTLDIAYTNSSGYADRQLDLIYDYQQNIKLYLTFQKYVREYQPRLLAIWGKNDPSFIPKGAEAFKKDNPNARVILLNSGHFALETHAEIISQQIKLYFSN